MEHLRCLDGRTRSSMVSISLVLLLEVAMVEEGGGGWIRWVVELNVSENKVKAFCGQIEFLPCSGRRILFLICLLSVGDIVRVDKDSWS